MTGSLMTELAAVRFELTLGHRLIGVLSTALLLGGLMGCQTAGEGSGGFPSLHSVPDKPRPNLPVEERRQIVRDLVEERGRSRENSAVVRQRSGLESEAAGLTTDDDLLAEDVIPETAEPSDNTFILRRSRGSGSGSTLRQDSEGDDGGLNDFIRQLQRDTTPAQPAQDETLDEGEGEETSFFLPGGHLMPAAFVPALTASSQATAESGLRLVQEAEPSTFCRFFGWTVGWSNFCVADAEGPTADDTEEDVNADVEEEQAFSDDVPLPSEDAFSVPTDTQEPRPATSGTTAPSPAPAADQADDLEPSGVDEQTTGSEGEAAPAEPSRRARTEDHFEGDDDARALEDVGQDLLAPVTGSLERLREFLRARRTAADIPAAQRESEAFRNARSSAAGDVQADGPPVPSRRPERRDDLTIVDRDERFEFLRTPTPAFKPTPDQPIILEPAEPRDRPARVDMSSAAPAIETGRSSQTSIPAADAAAIPDRTPQTASLPQPAAPSAEPLIGSAPLIIAFEPDTQGLPLGAKADLIKILDDARSQNSTILLIGEAGTNHLAKRRVTDIGARLVQLGATAELLEYDHVAIPDVDRVRLILRRARANS